MTLLQCDIDHVRYIYNPVPKKGGITISCNMWKYNNDWIPYCEYRRLRKNKMCGILHRCYGGMKFFIQSRELTVLAHHECTDAIPLIASVATALNIDIFSSRPMLWRQQETTSKKIMES